MDFLGFRCLNCGHIEDTVILANQVWSRLPGWARPVLSPENPTGAARMAVTGRSRGTRPGTSTVGHVRA